jgi:hypothetical protein
MLLAYAGQSSAELLIPQYVITYDEPRTGTILRHTSGAGFPVPVKRRYDQLTPEEQAIVHSWYERVEPGDEPPYPAKGLAPIFDAVQRGQQKLMVRGDLEMAVSVDSGGKAVDVHVLESPSAEMTEFVASVLLMTDFKPAICKGQPCRMQFPVAIRFALDYDEDRIEVLRPLNNDP